MKPELPSALRRLTTACLLMVSCVVMARSQCSVVTGYSSVSVDNDVEPDNSGGTCASLFTWTPMSWTGYGVGTAVCVIDYDNTEQQFDYSLTYTTGSGAGGDAGCLLGVFAVWNSGSESCSSPPPDGPDCEEAFVTGLNLSYAVPVAGLTHTYDQTYCSMSDLSVCQTPCASDQGDTCSTDSCGNACGSTQCDGTCDSSNCSTCACNAGTSCGSDGCSVIDCDGSCNSSCGGGGRDACGGCAEGYVCSSYDFPFPICQPLEDPILIDLSGNGFSMTDQKGGVNFDFYGNGKPHRIAWTAAGVENGWLALDLNHNGKIDNGEELFSNVTPQPGLAAQHLGFKALAQYDGPKFGGNGDGVIDDKDAIYSRLLIWVDRNHNGVTDPGELITLKQAGIKSISLDYFNDASYPDLYGNQFRYRARVVWTDASKNARQGWAYDVTLITAQRSGGR